ncbi:MAG TPA: hypothetical protein VHX92_07130 [Rhizomicrobium sp.]|jgi:hypothetical protein|nr:hypothetical protein [Rhizomicrobium sp.]
MKSEILPPMTATVHVRTAGRPRGIRLWLPLFLIWLLLLPLLILLLPFLFVGALVLGINLWRSLKALNGVLAATRGTHVEVANRDTNFFIRLH